MRFFLTEHQAINVYAQRLQSCGIARDLFLGREIHGQIVRSGLSRDRYLANRLIDMYGKCGNLDQAQRVFHGLRNPNLYSWSILLAAYAQNGAAGHSIQALELLDRMLLEGLMPDSLTFVGIFSGFNHVGQMDLARQCFRSMSTDFAIAPILEHYCCMIGVFGRVGEMGDARDLFESMPFEPTSIAWNTILGCCNIHSDLLRCNQAIQSSVPATFVLLSNMFLGRI
ncbi:hypothetical protein SELMODRAFT_98177 [Selaginella moellendorffii]|uniref:Pentacotripeptide-repeat region of PRORP domain-containing protein n=1 Tax=Selaginella moellendorffii TaxID=88036 RepID=D8RPC5_SELML|nr:hypothetical protein SELMODRAFT_98177 [Selaginella moellendorffii]